MMNTRMLKAILVGMLLIGSTGGSLFANGQNERLEVRIGEEKEADVQVINEYGKRILKIFPVSGTNHVDFLFIKKGDRIFNMYGDLMDSITLANIANRFSGEIQNYSVIGKDGSVYTVQGSLEHDQMFFSEEDLKELEAARARGLLEVAIPITGGEEDVEVIGANADGSIVRMATTVTTNFFKEESTCFEKAFANAPEDTSYTKKALSFMATFFTDTEEHSRFEGIVNEHFDIETLLTCDESIENFASYQRWFQRAFVSQFLYRANEAVEWNEKTLQLPFLEIDENGFTSIYGGTDNTGNTLAQNPYVKAYLLYSFATENEDGSFEGVPKPVLSRFIEEEYERQGIPYDYTLTVPLTGGEGELLARAALRYYTWGVEHTQNTAGSIISDGYAGNEVYGRFQEEIQSWISGSSTEMDEREISWNYLPYEPQESGRFGASSVEQQVATVQAVTGAYYSDRLQFLGFLKDDQNMKISRLDMWTSENIVWKPGRILEVIVEGKEEVQNTERLYDRKVFLDGGVSTPRNLHITREEDENKDPKPISIEYKFSEGETVGGLLLIRGMGDNIYPLKDADGNDVPGPLTSDQFKNDENRTVEIFVNGNRVTACEYVYAYDDGKIFRYEGAKFGFALSCGNHPYFDANNSQLAYIYYVFDTPIENSQSVKIVDDTGTAFLNAAEFMVFPDDPIQYITEVYRDSSIDAESVIGSISPGHGEWTWENNEGARTDTIKYILNNGNPEAYLSIQNSETPPIENSNWLEVEFPNTYAFQQFVIWEPNASESSNGSEIYRSPILTLTSRADQIVTSEHFSRITEVDLAGNLQTQGFITTPFVSEVITPYGTEIDIYPGNPIPYAPVGIDSPRTFAYKMDQQVLAREWLKAQESGNGYYHQVYPDESTTFAIDRNGLPNYGNSYATEIDVVRTAEKITLHIDPSKGFRYTSYIDTPVKAGTNYVPYEDENAVIKAYVPGKYINSSGGMVGHPDSLYSPDKTAGVDSIGMLAGSLAMSGIEGQFLNAFNVDVAELIDGYFKMSEAQVDEIELTGVDSEGKPGYYTSEGKSYLDTPYRLTRADLERTSVLVPSLHLAQLGDLVVLYTEDSEPHIGIVVDTSWPGDPETLSVDELMEGITIIHVRRGFGQVGIGTWGNPVGSFGGFAANPKEYHLRRLLKLPAGVPMTQRTEEDEWELVKEIPIRTRTHYQPHYNVPWTFNEALPYRSGSAPTDVNVMFKNLNDGMVGPAYWEDSIRRYYYLELPRTSYVNKAERGVFEENTQMRVSCLSGWRNFLYDN
ncbi:MAG: hypothetical protein KAU17_02130, partial [Spirochaetales bacterium]|nr:hypothetical protein [Spirochaetales bacterium]